MSVKVKYKGEQILSLNTDAEKALSTMGQYCEDDITIENVQDGGAEITDGIVVKARNADGYATEVDYYGAVVPQYQFGCGRSDTPFWAQYLESVNLMDDVVELGSGAFSACGRSAESPADFILPESCTKTGNGAFLNCGFNSVTAFFTDLASNNQVFSGTYLKGVYLPRCTQFQSNSSYGNFRGATGLQTVVLGSVGYGITQIGYPFRDYGAGTATVTVFCVGTYADTVLSVIRNDMPNATIIIKASEDTTYDGVSYNAGDMMVTSTP